MPRRPAAAAAAACLLALAAAGAARAAAPAELRIGIFMPSGRIDRMEHMVTWINERDDVLPNTTMVPELLRYSVAGDSYLGAYALAGECGTIDRVDAFTVPWSQSTEAAGRVAAATNLPLLASNAGGGIISDNELFPTTVRVSGNMLYRANVMVALLLHQGWTRVGLVALTGEPYADSFGRVFLERAETAGIEVVVSLEMLKTDTAVEMAEHMSLLRAADARVIVGAASPVETGILMEAAGVNGLVGERYQWVLTSTFGGSRFTNADMWSNWPHFEGALSMNDFVNTSAPGYQTFVDWVNREIDAGETYMSGSLSDSKDIFRMEVLLLAAHAFQLKWDEEERCGALGADAQRADEVCAYLLDEADADTRSVYFIKRVRFEGLVGPVELDENGDRAFSHTLYQFRWVDNNQTYNSSEPLAFDITQNLFQNEVGLFNHASGEISFDSPLRYYRNSTARPLDGPVQRDDVSSISPGLQAGVGAVAALVGAAALGLIAFTTAQRKRKIIKMSSPRINNLSTFGCVFAMATLGVYGLGSDSDAKCAAQQWTLPLAITLIFGPLFAKIYRVNGIFNATKLSKTHVAKDSQLFAGVGAMLLVDALLLGLWNGVNPLEARATVLPLELSGNDNVARPYVYKCAGDNSDVWLSLVIAYKAALMVAGAALAYKTRNVTIPALNDAKWIGFAVYNWAIALSFGLPVAMVLQDNPTSSYVMTSAALLFAVVGTLALVHGPKILAIVTKTEDEWTATGNTTVNTTNSTRAKASRTPGKRSSTTAGRGRGLSVSVDKPRAGGGAPGSPGTPDLEAPGSPKSMNHASPRPLAPITEPSSP